MKKEKSKSDETSDGPRRPDYSSESTAVWINERDGRKWLSIKIKGMDKAFVAFENKKDE
jgi:hypothetical protein